MITKKQWIAFRLIFTDGLSYAQAAEKMDISKTAVARLIKRIRNTYSDCVPKIKMGKILSYDRLTDDEKAGIKESF